MKDELGRKMMTKFVRLRQKTCSYLIDDSRKDKKAKGTKRCVIKTKLKFENYKSCLETTQLERKINYPEKNKIDRIYRMLIIGGIGSGKTNLLFNLINQQPDIDNIY